MVKNALRISFVDQIAIKRFSGFRFLRALIRSQETPEALSTLRIVWSKLRSGSTQDPAQFLHTADYLVSCRG